MEGMIIDAAKQGDIERLRTLIAESGEVNQKDQHGWTALHWAAGKGDVDVVRCLLEGGADAAATGKDERTPLMVAKAAGKRDVVVVLRGAEQSRGNSRESGSEQQYCRAYQLRDLQRYPRWNEERATGGHDQLDGADVVYVHRDFTVTGSMWHGQDVLLGNVTPEWKAFCEESLNFSVPEDLL